MTVPVTPVPAGGPENSETAGSTKARMPAWLVRTIIGAAAAVVLVVGYLIASVTVPLMWATTVRDQSGGGLGNSIPLAIFYGFTFTFAPILIAWQAHHRKLNKWVRISLLSGGILLLTPNLLTLGVIYGQSNTSADARAIWATSTNWFGTWSQAFMVVGVVCAVAVIVLGRMWLRRSRKLREVKAAEKLVRKDHQARERVAREDAKAAARAAAKANRGKPAAGNADTAAAPDAGPSDTTQA